MSNCGIITKVYEDGLGFELGLEVGDKILEINGQALNDIIDYRFALADEEIELDDELDNEELDDLLDELYKIGRTHTMLILNKLKEDSL